MTLPDKETNNSLVRRLNKARHDLRNPLSDILGFCEMLQEEAEEGAFTVLLPNLEQVYQHATALLNQVNEGLMLASFSETDFNPNELQLKIQHCAGQISELAAALIAKSEQLQLRNPSLNDDLNRIWRSANALIDLTARAFQRIAQDQPKDDTSLLLFREQSQHEQASPHPVETHPSSGPALPASLLVVEDNESNRALLSRRLSRQGFSVQGAESGREALDLLHQGSFDLVLLDIMMPGLNGYQVLDQMKADTKLRHIPVIMITALDDLKTLVRCIEKGAEDYLTKPFDPVLLKARIGACLEKKRMRDQEQVYLRQLQDYLTQIQLEQEKSERLMLNILPGPIAERLKEGELTIADNFRDVTVLFADLVGFTALAQTISPGAVVQLLNQVFSTFDRMADEMGLEKIKTIGDCYMVVGGLPTPHPDHARAIADLALGMLQQLAQFNQATGHSIQIRIGIHTGSVVAGVIGTNKFVYDLWGDTVNTASRMESHGQPDCIHVSHEAYELLKTEFKLNSRGEIHIKGKGKMTTYFLVGKA